MLYQLFHCLRSVVVSVVSSLAAGPGVVSFVLPAVLYFRASTSGQVVLYPLFHHPRSVVVAVVPSLAVTGSPGQSLYQSFRRLRSVVVFSRSTARGQSLYCWFHRLRPVIVSVAPLQWSVVEPVVQSSQSVVPKLTFSSYIRCSIARGHSFHHSFHLSRHCFSRSIAGGQSLYQSFYCLLSVIVFVVPSLAVSSWISRFIALIIFHRSWSVIVSVAVFKKRDQQAWRVYVTRADTQQ